ncbi:ABC transporter permease [Streptomyces iakyrus]|uniref:ABC transporter permease n=1 Tax=Streptomyces iakyrus TaxID=68219 RepID=A0ABW8FGG7_9ACTN
MTAATALTRSELPLRSAVYALILGPLVIPQIVTALGLFLLFEPAAMLGSLIAIALGHTVPASPIAVLILIATLRGIDERLEDAAACMGAGRMTIARRITFPLAAPGMIAAAVFSFITSEKVICMTDTLTAPSCESAVLRTVPSGFLAPDRQPATDGHVETRRRVRPGRHRPADGRPQPGRQTIEPADKASSCRRGRQGRQGHRTENTTGRTP